MGSISRDRAGRAPTEAERKRATESILRRAQEGLLSQREVESGVERIFRARTPAELLAISAAMPGSAIADAGVILARGVADTVPRRKRHWATWIVTVTIGLLLIETLVWMLSGLGVAWLAVATLGTAAAFTKKLIGHGRKTSLLRPSSRRR